jgi:hypothetical protein
MAGGFLNIIALGNANFILTGNPSKTFFKIAYSKYTNFGLQKFRLDYEGSRDLRLTEESQFTFKIKRYADLLMDTYVVVNLPDIWSPIYNPSLESDYKWIGYDFRWIEDIGIQMIKSVEINCGSALIQKYTGAYLSAMVERDFTKDKKDLFNQMSGNTASLNDPANAFGRENAYPSAFYTKNNNGAEPSIRGKTIYIPVNTWFTLDSRCAFPLISLQYSELTVTVTMRPIQDLFRVRDIFDSENDYPYIKPDFNQEQFKMYHFLQTPPAIRIDNNSLAYDYKQQIWNADIHLMSTFCFLSDAESKKFAKEDQIYLVKNVIQYEFINVTGSKRLKLENSSNMVSNWMFYFQRNDVNMRNEWSNYTNWPYNSLPSNVMLAPNDVPTNINNGILDKNMHLFYGPRVNPRSQQNTGIFVTGDFSTYNQKEILLTMGILLEGDYRENTMESGVYNLIEKYTRTNGFAKDGIYCYNFCLSTDPFVYQPSGAINLSKFKNIELEITTFIPQIDPNNASFNIICSTTGQPISVTRKAGWQLYQYNYNMTLFEERYNILSFIGGQAGLLYAN